MALRALGNPLASFIDYLAKTGTDASVPYTAQSGLTATGGVISDYVDGLDVYRTHIFTSSGTFDVSSIGTFGSNVEYLVVAGGGGGGYYDGGGGASGAVRSPEFREKLRQANLGKQRPQWIYDKIAASNTGKKASAETRAKQSAARKGRKCTEEHKRKVSEAKKGFKHTDEAKQKMSVARKGKKLSPEHVEKISKAVKLRALPHKLTFIDGRTLIVNHIGDWAKENGYRGSNLYQVKIGDKGRHKDIVKVELVE